MHGLHNYGRIGMRLPFIGYLRSLIRTTRGIHIGSPERGIRRKYGSVRLEAHAYVRGGEYLTYVSKRDNRYRIVFDTNRRKPRYRNPR